MSTALATQNGGALALAENELIEVLASSLYPGAAIQSIKMVLGYCKAANLDPMQKPVHIVPMWDKAASGMRDVIMPGIGLYRIQAARTGEHAGTDEPIFGPMVELDLGGLKITVPEWCKVTVYRLVGGQRCAYTATEYWVENYATAKKDTAIPNAMWKKRSRGQLSKCAEAQALRKGFPEVGSAPTAEEMEGKTLHDDMAGDRSTMPAAENRVATLPAYPAEGFEKNLPTWRGLIESGKKTADQVIATVSTKGALSDEQVAALRAIKSNVVEMETA
jgi:phage recombination protein Bet